MFLDAGFLDAGAMILFTPVQGIRRRHGRTARKPDFCSLDRSFHHGVGISGMLYPPFRCSFSTGTSVGGECIRSKNLNLVLFAPSLRPQCGISCTVGRLPLYKVGNPQIGQPPERAVARLSMKPCPTRLRTADQTGSAPRGEMSRAFRGHVPATASGPRVFRKRA